MYYKPIILIQSLLVSFSCGKYPEHAHQGHGHEQETCNIQKTYKEFMDAFGPRDPTFLRASCFLCTFPSYDVPNLVEKANPRPMYNNMLELAFMRKDIKSSFTINVYFNEFCYYSIHSAVSPPPMYNGFYTVVKLCNSQCKTVFKWDQEVLKDFTVISFTAKIYPNGTILIKRSTDPRKLSTAYRRNERNYFASVSCPFKKETRFYSKVITIYDERMHNTQINDFIAPAVAVPCGPGGYAVDPTTGKIATDPEYIKNTFGDIETLKKAVITFYPSSNVRFAPVPYDTKNRKPGYVDTGKYEPIEEMGPFANPSKNNIDSKDEEEYCCHDDDDEASNIFFNFFFKN